MRMAAMPEAQLGLLAEAVKVTGEPSCEPLVGEVTVTTGVVQNALALNIEIPEAIAQERASRGHCIQKRPSKRMGFGGGER
jgi:hypothetical protein